MYFSIGKIAAAHGVQGAVIVHHHLGKKTDLKGLKAIFTEEGKNKFLPWFPVSITARSNDELIMQLEGINSREEALKLIRREVWLPEEDFRKFSATSAPARLLGFTIIENGKELGKVLELIEQPHQVLCRLEIQEREVLIPLNEETLLKTYDRKKEIHVKLPEGLLDIYLNTKY